MLTFDVFIHTAASIHTPSAESCKAEKNKHKYLIKINRKIVTDVIKITLLIKGESIERNDNIPIKV